MEGKGKEVVRRKAALFSQGVRLFSEEKVSAESPEVGVIMGGRGSDPLCPMLLTNQMRQELSPEPWEQE